MEPIETERLLLRPWADKDLEPFATINRDKRVMEFFPDILSREKTVQFIDKVQAHIKEHGFGFPACTIKETGEFIGFVGISIPDYKTHFTPCVEIGWRLSADHWGKGYATEAAKRMLEYGFNDLNLDEIVSFTVPDNTHSRNVMEKLGMKHDIEGDFKHPKVDEDNKRCLHVLYRLSKEDYKKTERN